MSITAQVASSSSGCFVHGCAPRAAGEPAGTALGTALARGIRTRCAAPAHPQGRLSPLFAPFPHRRAPTHHEAARRHARDGALKVVAPLWTARRLRLVIPRRAAESATLAPLSRCLRLDAHCGIPATHEGGGAVRTRRVSTRCGESSRTPAGPAVWRCMSHLWVAPPSPALSSTPWVGGVAPHPCGALSPRSAGASSRYRGAAAAALEYPSVPLREPAAKPHATRAITTTAPPPTSIRLSGPTDASRAAPRREPGEFASPPALRARILARGRDDGSLSAARNAARRPATFFPRRAATRCTHVRLAARRQHQKGRVAS